MAIHFDVTSIKMFWLPCNMVITGILVKGATYVYFPFKIA